MRLLYRYAYGTVANLRSMMCHYALRAPYRKSCFQLVGFFAGAKFHGIASEGTRRNFRSFNFRGARAHGAARRYWYSNFNKPTKFCTTRKFGIMGGVFVQCACAYVGVRGYSYGGNPPFEILATPLHNMYRPLHCILYTPVYMGMYMYICTYKFALILTHRVRCFDCQQLRIVFIRWGGSEKIKGFDVLVCMG